jgi:hypothetical protein
MKKEKVFDHGWFVRRRYASENTFFRAESLGGVKLMGRIA